MYNVYNRSSVSKVGNLPGRSGGADFSLPVFLSVPVASEITRFHLNYNRERHSDAQTGVDLINSVYRNSGKRRRIPVERRSRSGIATRLVS